MNRHVVTLSIAALQIFCLTVSISASAAATPKQIYQQAGPAVVFILAADRSKTGSVGTGSIIRGDGLVITNAHIFVRSGSSRMKKDVSVYLKPDRVTGDHTTDLSKRYRGTILAYDIPLDLALLQIQGIDRPLRRIEFADSTGVVVGDQVYAIGHPEQGGLWSLTTGVISAFRRDYGGVRGKNLFQTDASINRGNSGGPLLDNQGNMVGINSLIARKAADGLTITDVNYSIMSSVALKWLAGLGYRFEISRTANARQSQISSNTTEQQPSGVRPTPQTEPVPRASDSVETAPEPDRPPDSEPPARPPRSKIADKPSESPQQAAPATPSPDPAPRADTKPDQPPGEGKILTRKKPYKMSNLLREMQEMEDMMEDMKGKIQRYKETSRP